jgi:hypothetical protein
MNLLSLVSSELNNNCQIKMKILWYLKIFGTKQGSTITLPESHGLVLVNFEYFAIPMDFEKKGIKVKSNLSEFLS